MIFQTKLASSSVRIGSSFQPFSSQLLQRKCACGGTRGPSGECAECRKKQLQRDRMRSARTPQDALFAPPIVHEALRSPGQPLDAHTRAFMESRFGHDFAKVRVHNDSLAARSATEVHAQAYTVGQNIVFSRGAYTPSTTTGRALIAHELAHVVQQSSAYEPMASSGLRIDPSVSAESDARDVARRVMNVRSIGLGASVEATQLQRLPLVARAVDELHDEPRLLEPREDDPCAGYERDPQSMAWSIVRELVVHGLGRTPSGPLIGCVDL